MSKYYAVTEHAVSPFFTIEQLVRQDLAFKRAMLREIKAGTEKVTPGVVRARYPNRPIHFAPTYDTRSLYGSSAALCAASGEFL